MTANPIPETAASPFEALVRGDRVILDNGSNYGRENAFTLESVERVTATQIILAGEQHKNMVQEPKYRFSRRDGSMLARKDSWTFPRLVIVTPELLEKIEKAKLVRRFTALKWKDIHIDTLRAVNAAIKTPPASPTPTEPEAGK